MKNQKSKIILELLAKTIKEERKFQNKSLRLLADEYDIQKSLLSRIENGVNESKIISIWVISEALGMPVSVLMKKVEDKLPKDFSLVEK